MTEHINDREEETFVNEAAEDVTAEPQATLEGPEPQRTASEQFGESLRKAAEETAYATVGFVGLVADKAKEFYEDQKKQYAEAHPDADVEQGTRNFLSQMKEQLDKLIEDVGSGFRDMAERGRTSAKPTVAEEPVAEEPVAEEPEGGTNYDI